MPHSSTELKTPSFPAAELYELRLRKTKQVFMVPFSQMCDVIRMEYCRQFVNSVTFEMSDREKRHMERVMYESIKMLNETKTKTKTKTKTITLYDSISEFY